MSALPATRPLAGKSPWSPTSGLRQLRSRASGLRLLGDDIAPVRRAAPTGLGRLRPLVTVAAAAALGAVVVTHGDQFVDAFDRALHGSLTLVAAGALLEAASIAGYVFLFHHAVSSASPLLRRRDSYDISLAGTAATRLLPTAGLGGAAVSVWALRARGVRPREITERLIAFLLLLYGVYVVGLVSAGIAVAAGLVHAPRGATLGIVGAVLGAAIATFVVGTLSAPGFAGRGLRRIAAGESRLSPLAARLEPQLPVLRASVLRAARELRRPHPALLGALAWWGFDIGVLFVMLHAFGQTPALPVVVLAYFLGSLFNLLPLPGSLSGGLAGMLIALGTPAGPALAAVLAYRALAIWGPAAVGIASAGSLRASVIRWRAESAEGEPDDLSAAGTRDAARRQDLTLQAA